tara:strand:+ start:5905 stop:6345 length:441 start_codon:yes stop_codon:yes gene_type:complete
MRVFAVCLSVGFLAACQKASAPVVETAPPAPVVIEAQTPPPVEIAPEPRFVIDNIMNLARGTLRDILGDASLVRKEKDAEVWLYRNDHCVMHLYFYPNDNDDYRLEYVNTRGVGLSLDNPTVSPNACLDSHLLAAPQTPGGKAVPE